MRFSTYSYVLLALSPVTQGIIIAMLVKKRLHREMPIFLSYTVFTLAAGLIGIAINKFGTQPQYFYFFWTSNFLSVALGFGVIREVFANVLKPYTGIQKMANLLLLWALLMLAVTAVVSGATSSDRDYLQVTNTVIAFEKTVRLLQFGLIVLLFYFTKILGLGWKHYTFGIAFGFAIFSSVNLIIYGVRSQLGPVADGTLAYLTPTAFFIATAVWAVYLAMPAPAMAQVTALPAHELARWDSAIRTLVYRS